MKLRPATEDMALLALTHSSTTPSASSSTTEPCFILGHIPLEIRCKIYDLCALFPSNSTLYAPEKASNSGFEYRSTICAPIRYASFPVHQHGEDEDPIAHHLLPNKTVFVLAATRREIRNEIFSRYFGTNTWSFPSGHEMMVFLTGVGIGYVKEIRKLELIWGGDLVEEQMLALGQCVNLRSLHIAIDKKEMIFGMSYDTAGVPALMLQIREMKDVDVKVRQISCWHGRQNVTADFGKDIMIAPTWEKSFSPKEMAGFEAFLRGDKMADLQTTVDTQQKAESEQGA